MSLAGAYRIVPEWRRRAGAGVSLAAARGADSQLPTANSQGTAAGVPPELGRIIRTDAQPRWLLPQLSMITPQYLETILRGAMVGNHLFQWQLFDMMEDTWPRLVKNLNELKRCAISELMQAWRLESWHKRQEAPSVEAEEKTALVQEALFEMKGNPARNENAFEDTLYDILDAWGKGTSLLEIEWEARESGDLGTILAPQSTVWVHPKNYAWDGDGNLGLVLPESEGYARSVPWVRTDLRMNEAGTLVPLVENKFLLAICRSKSGHPLAGALLRPLAWWWCAANFSADWLLNYAQIFGIPIRWTTYDQGVPQATVDAICEMLANMGSQGWGAFPAGTALELKEGSKGGNELPQASVLDRADQQCDLLVLGETLTATHGSQSGGQGGSRALGEVHERVRDQVVHAAAGFMARVLNTQAIPAICRLNYDEDTELPAFVPNEEDPEAAKANAEVIQVAVAAGVPVPVDYALAKLNIPKAGEGEEMLGAPTPALPAGFGNPNTENRNPKEDQNPKSEGGAGSGNPNAENRSPKEDRNPKSEEGAAAAAEATAAGGNGHHHSLTVPAADAAMEKLTNHVLEDLTGVEAKWLGNVKPVFRRLCAAAQSSKVSNEEFVQVIEKAQREMPELFAKLDGKAVATALENAMGAAAANGAARGFMERRISGLKPKIQSPGRAR